MGGRFLGVSSEFLQGLSQFPHRPIADHNQHHGKRTAADHEQNSPDSHPSLHGRSLSEKCHQFAARTD